MWRRLELQHVDLNKPKTKSSRKISCGALTIFERGCDCLLLESSLTVAQIEATCIIQVESTEKGKHQNAEYLESRITTIRWPPNRVDYNSSFQFDLV